MMPARKSRQQNWMPAIFNDFFDSDWMPRGNATAPAINVYETEKEYCVEVAAPGLTKKDFDIEVDEMGDLIITMEKKCETEEKEGDRGRYLRREFSYSKFRQTLLLPQDVSPDKIEAHVQDGVLTVTLPRQKPQPEQSHNKQIAIS